MSAFEPLRTFAASANPVDMRSSFLLVLAVTGCATSQPSADLRFIDPATPLGTNILRFHKDVARLNASVGGEKTSYLIKDFGRAEHVRRAIQARMSRDVLEHCPDHLVADAAYLLIGEDESGHFEVAKVARVERSTPEGAYVSTCGLVYRLDEATGAVRGVMSDRY